MLGNEDRMICRLLIWIIYAYRWIISPIVNLIPRCRFTPTCSQYAIHCLQHHGLKNGLIFIARRLLRCHPYEKLGGAWGYDPVPPTTTTTSVQSEKRVT